jgi:hypothetical protein
VTVDVVTGTCTGAAIEAGGAAGAEPSDRVSAQIPTAAATATTVTAMSTGRRFGFGTVATRMSVHATGVHGPPNDRYANAR